MDKPVNFVIFENGKAGILGEHSVMDGTPTVALCDTVLDMIADPKFDLGVPRGDGSSITLPQPLDFTVSGETKEAITKAKEAAVELIEGQEMGIVRTAYGKAAIKKFGVSPDSWTQMIIQLAYARFLQSLNLPREGGTYEAATTRRFLKGRTEAIRVVSEESDKWVQSMDEEGVSVEEKKRLFGEATRKHVGWAKMAGTGMGVDRHLLGMRECCVLCVVCCADDRLMQD